MKLSVSESKFNFPLQYDAQTTLRIRNFFYASFLFRGNLHFSSGTVSTLRLLLEIVFLMIGDPNLKRQCFRLLKEFPFLVWHKAFFIVQLCRVILDQPVFTLSLYSWVSSPSFPEVKIYFFHGVVFIWLCFYIHREFLEKCSW